MTGLPAALLFLVVIIAASTVDAAIPNRDGQHDCIDCDISERQRCECREHLRKTGKAVAYICDPDSENRFLVCHGPDRVVCQNCAGGTKWNAAVGACGSTRKCDPFLCAPQPPTVKPVPVPVYKPVPVPVIIKYVPVTTTPPPTTITTTTSTTTLPPPPPTFPEPEPVCDVYYEYHPEKMNWMSAKRVCEASQGTLATIPTTEVQSYIRERFGSSSKSKRFWLGANDRNREGSWEWVTGERFGFTNWYRSRPTYKRDYDCLQYNYGFGMWSDEDCSLNKPFLCQYMVCAKK